MKNIKKNYNGNYGTIDLGGKSIKHQRNSWSGSDGVDMTVIFSIN